ncbi:MAG: hypothetical protein JXA78_16615 [Anaerolineales bacterium]|nr:hypothetical protein [Anaerolineales bacterium]
MNIFRYLLNDCKLRLAPVAAALAGRGMAPMAPAFETRPMLLQGSGGSAQKPKKTVSVQRRRKTGDSEDRQRAEAPQRRKPAAQRPPTSSATSAGLPPSAAPSMPSLAGLAGGKRPPLIVIGLLIVAAICILPILLMVGPQESGEVFLETPFIQADATQPAVAAIPTATRKPFVPPATSSASEGDTWLVMLYQDADDKILEQDIYVDLNEVERVGSSEQVQIVAQVDRFRAGYQGDGNWTSTKRFYITQDEDLNTVRSQEVADLGEVNMSDGQTLVDFVVWAIQNFPADRYALILSDHGMGWPGGWSDPAPGGRGVRGIPLAEKLGDELYLMELDQALADIQAQTGLDKFELIGMDACLMGHLEVFASLSPYARYAVASQEVEPSVGWAYKGFLEALRANPGMNGAELGRLIVESYIQDDQRIVDDQARAEFLQKGSPMGGLFSLFGGGGTSAEYLAQQLSKGSTLTAVDLQAMDQLQAEFNNLSFALQEERQNLVAQSRSYAQSFTSIFGEQVPPSYIDLGHFVQLLKRQVSSANVTAAIDGVLAALDQAVIAEKHGPDKPGATGVSIYFPNSELYRNPTTGAESYTAIARRFAEISLWDDFLAFHYTGRGFEAAEGAISVPERGADIRPPGLGKIQISEVRPSSSTAAPGSPIILSADISGQNLGYIYLFVGYYDAAANSILVADSDYLESANTREVNGVYYPVWDEEPFTMEFEWEPVVFAISNGTDVVTALFTPQSYGRTFEEAIYTVEGTYTYADGGESRYARLYFQDGYLRQVYGFTSEDGTGAPREITPQNGDTFTVLEKWMDLDAQGGVAQVARQAGSTITFSGQMFAWEALDAAPGQYIVGFIVEDLDGNAYQSFTQVMVE